MPPLRHGIFLAPFHGMRENPALCFQRDLELLEQLDRLGFDEAWIGEHHSGGMETIDSPEIFIAAAAERTRRIRLGTGVVSLPYHHPLNVAGRLIQLDHMTRGRVMFGAGPGLLPSDALAMGVEPMTTRDRMTEALDVILRLLKGEVVTEETEWYSLRDARTHLRPYSDPHPEVCVASAFTPSGGKIAGRYGLGMLCVAATDPQGFDALATNWQIACDTAADHGTTMDRGRVRVVVPLHLADTRAQAKDDIRFGVGEYIRYMNNTLPRFDLPEDADPADWFADSGEAVIGTPDDAIERIEQLLERHGDFGCVLILGTQWADWAQTTRSFELYARYVMPHFSGVNASRTASYRWVTENGAEFIGKRRDAAAAQFDRRAAPAQTTP